MKHLTIFIAAIFFVFTFNSFGQKADTVLIQKQNLEFKYLRTGNSTYVIYFKKTATSPAEKMALVKMSVEPIVVDGRKAFAITQQWEADNEIAHKSYTIHDASDFSTLRQETWWKRTGYTAKFDFIKKEVAFEGTVDDAAKARIVDDFNQSFENYNLCWHSDLIIFSMFPYKDGRTFKVNFYDPGSTRSKITDYVVTGSESLTGGDGEKIDCWIMEFKYEMPSGGTGSQRLWISKRTREVLKEEDQFPGGFRYKMKIGVSGEK